MFTTDLDVRLNTFDDLPHVLYGEPKLFAFAEFHISKSRREGARTCRAITLELPSHRPQSLLDLDYWAQRLHRELESIQESRLPSSMRPALSGEPGECCEAGELIATIIDPAGRRAELRTTVDTVPLCIGAAQ